MFVPLKGCPTHGTDYLRFYDPGRTEAARWVCGRCGTELQKARMTPCACEYSHALPELNRPKAERFLRLYPVTEPGLYIPQVVPFINFPEEEEQQLSRLEDAYPLLLARSWGILTRRVLDVADEKNHWAVGGKKGGPATIEMKMAELFVVQNPDSELAKEYLRMKTSTPGLSEVNRVKETIGEERVSGPPPRKLVEHVALQDNMDVVTIDAVANRLRQRSQTEQGRCFEQESRHILARLGLKDVMVINDFPIALTAVGFTRVTRDPSRTILNPFPPGEDGRIPLFVIPTETEGLSFQLDPVSVAKWLSDNGLAAGALPQTESDAWPWLYQKALHCILTNGERCLRPCSALEH